jgi:hypothetical protein
MAKKGRYMKRFRVLPAVRRRQVSAMVLAALVNFIIVSEIPLSLPLPLQKIN